MANPILPGISEAEQELLYKKLNEYNQGRTSYKEAGAYLVVLPRPESPRYSLWVYSPLPRTPVHLVRPGPYYRRSWT